MMRNMNMFLLMEIHIDNHNNYYDPALKEARLARHLYHESYTHVRCDISARQALEKVFSEHKPQVVVNLAAQAGVQYSINNPSTYVKSNLKGFLNVLELCRKFKVEHLVYASSSSVYGANEKMPLSAHDSVDHPLSLYAATKKANELMAHTYSHLYDIPTTGLRFFTVYGPWGRPDMAIFKFTKAIQSDEKIQLHNFGNHERDFTYIDDIIEGVIRVLKKIPKENKRWDGKKPDPGTSFAPWRLYNIGNNNPIKITKVIGILEREIGKKAILDLVPLRAGDVLKTFADIDDLKSEFSYKPATPLETGVSRFVDWYLEYYNYK